MRKGIILFLLLVFGICFEAHTTVINPAPFIAASAAANASAAASRRRMHENKYHNGPITYYTEKIERFEKRKDTFYIEHEFEKRKILYVNTYLKKYYYYQIDPDKCIQYVECELIKSREATKDEIKNRRFYAEILIGTLLIIIAITIAIIILVKIFNKDDEYELLEGCENITYLDY